MLKLTALSLTRRRKRQYLNNKRVKKNNIKSDYCYSFISSFVCVFFIIFLTIGAYILSVTSSDYIFGHLHTILNSNDIGSLSPSSLQLRKNTNILRHRTESSGGALYTGKNNEDKQFIKEDLSHEYLSVSLVPVLFLSNDYDSPEDETIFPYFGDSILDKPSQISSVLNRYTEYKVGQSPYRLTSSVLQKSDNLARQRREHIKHGMKHAWKGYKTNAFGHDEVLPVSGGAQDNWGELGTTLVDGLDTLWIMNMTNEFYEARNWVRDHLSHDRAGQKSLFEVTIRNLGGLLGAFDCSNDAVFLKKADDLGSRLLKAFETPSGLPYGRIDLISGSSNNAGWTGNNAILSEVGTLSMEFRYLGHITKKQEYTNAANRIFEVLKQVEPSNGLYPYFIHNDAPMPLFGNDKLTFGSMADSFYEYMLKLWLQSNRTEYLYRSMYDKSIDGMHDELLQKSYPSNLTYIADRINGKIDKKMDHLACFMGGLLALGAYTDPEGLNSERARRDLKTAKALTFTCYQMYAQMPSGLSPEFVRFDDDLQAGNLRYYILRPETVESFFVLHALTKDPIYREWGWEIFLSIEKYCKTDIAYGNKENVLDSYTGEIGNRMESYFLAETLKYLYLLMDPDMKLDLLHKHVFNTEAHPMRIFTSMHE